MPSMNKKISVPGKTADELYQTIEKQIDRFLEKTPIGKYELERDAAKKELRVKSSMVKATLSFREAEMQFNAELSFMAAPFKGKLEEGIDRWVSKAFSSSGSQKA